MNIEEKKLYASYLSNRRWTGFIYRYFFIYPFFLKYLGKKNLDYGCGIGDFLKFASIFKKDIDGLDINKFNIKICNQRGLNSKVMDKSFLSGIKKNTYDTIILDNVIEHISNPLPTIDILKKLLKNKGLLIIGIPVGKAGFDSDPDHKHYYSEESLNTLLVNKKFKKINEFYRPIKNNFLRDNLKQFCYFSVYIKL